MLVLVLLFIVLLLWSFHFYWTKRRLYRISWTVPGPKNLPFIGTSYLFFGSALKIAQRFMKIFDDYPDVGKIWLGDKLVYLVTKPEYLEVILNHQGALEKMDLYGFAKPIIGDGLITAPVPIWKRHRKLIMPTLNQKILNGYPGLINGQVDILLDIFQKESGKGEIDHCKYLTNWAVDILAESLFGVPINAQINNAYYSQTFDNWLEIVFMRMFRLDYHSDFLFSWTKEYKNETEIRKHIKNLINQLIEKKKEQLSCQLEFEEKRKPLLDLLVEKLLDGELTFEEVDDEVCTFFVAGADTNATSASFILTLLGMHQDIQEKLYQEAIQVLGPERPVTLEDLPELKYTERVIKESLRVFPGAPFVARIVDDDVDLGDLVIPKGSNVCFGYFHLHRSEKYWKEPCKFDPDRFLPENCLNRHAYTWLPFSGGIRNCVGGKFGMMALKILIPMVIRKFRVKSSIQRIEDIECSANLVLKPKDGFRLAFQLR